MKITAWLSGKYLQSLFSHNNHFLTEKNSISPTNYQELFIDYNQRPFSEPQDFHLKKACSQNKSHGYSDSVLEIFLDTVEQTTTLKLQYTVLAKEIKALETTLGDYQGSRRPHNFKLASFITPTSCYLCNSSIWGITKQGVTCKACSIHAHVKCRPKVPANHPGSAPMHSNHTHLSSAMATASPSPNSQHEQFILNWSFMSKRSC
ncbi:hypothetical protein BY996DRAFT_7120190 [Phakopsora pachyrhizi]|nr:hypothetical protein BY996DRAFT_7120190 [Phakopsora pachyrhizi]